MAPRWHTLTAEQREWAARRGFTRIVWDRRAAERDAADRKTYLPVGGGRWPLSPVNCKNATDCDGVAR